VEVSPHTRSGATRAKARMTTTHARFLRIRLSLMRRVCAEIGIVSSGEACYFSDELRVMRRSVGGTG
jgi:hypothetical protein